MEGINSIIHSKSKTFLAFCFCFLGGVAVISIVNIHIPFIFIYICLFLFVIFLITFWHDKTTRFILLGLFFLFFGAARYLLAFPLPYGHHIQNDIGKDITFEGEIRDEPDARSDSVRYIITASTADHEDARGNVYVKTNLYPRYEYGDKVTVSCRLQAPPIIDEGFRYDMYLARYGVFAVCNNPRVEKTGNTGGVAAALFRAKAKIAEHVDILWHEPYASFMAGLLYGYRGGLGELNNLFAKTGITHIVAVSGYNITIIATVLVTLCVHLLIPRKKAFWLVSTGIVLFVIFTGASGSAIRAGVMGFMVLLAKQLGRLSRIGNALIFTAAVMVLWNPFILVWDVGFQLSFLATLGLVYLSPMLEKFFTRVPGFIKDSLLATISAIIATLPLILFQFGRLSLVAPIVNILILWLVPWLMMIGFAAVVVSFFFFPMSRIIAWLGWLGLAYIIAVARWFAALPFAAAQFPMPWWWMVGVYVAMTYYVIGRTRLNTV